MSGTDAPDPAEQEERSFVLGEEPFAGFEVAVMTDRRVYAAGDTVRITVTATNGGGRFARHAYPGWQRFHLSVRDEHHREVAHDAVSRPPGEGFADRWLPGQMAIFPVYWAQHEGPLVPAWSQDPPGPRCLPGRYRVRATWSGREPGSRAELPDAWTAWFDLV